MSANRVAVIAISGCIFFECKKMLDLFSIYIL